MPNAALLAPIIKIAGGNEATTEAYGAAVAAVRHYAIAYKTTVPQRSDETMTTDATVFAGQAALARGLHATAVASARYLVRWAESSNASTRFISTRNPSTPIPQEVRMAHSTFEDALLATVCFYTGFLEHDSLPPIIDDAVLEMEGELKCAATSFHGLAVVLRLSRLAELGVEAHKHRSVEQASMVYDMLLKLASAVADARDHQIRYNRDTWYTTIFLLKVRLDIFSLAVTMSGLFVKEVRRFLEIEELVEKVSPADARAVEFGDWADKAKVACWAAVDLMLALVHAYGAGVLTDAEGQDGDSDDEPMDEDIVDDDDYVEEAEDDDHMSSDDEPADNGLDKTLFAQLLFTYERFRGVMETVWDEMPWATYEVAFDRYLQPPVIPAKTGATPPADTAPAASAPAATAPAEGYDDGAEMHGANGCHDDKHGTDEATAAEHKVHDTPAESTAAAAAGNGSVDNVHPIAAEGTIASPAILSNARTWYGWDQLGLELCRQLSKPELAAFEEHNLDPALHKRWRAELRAETAARVERSTSRSVSAEKRRADDDDDEAGRGKRRKSDHARG